MKKIVLTISSIISFCIGTGYAQTVLDDFNDGSVADWDTTGIGTPGCGNQINYSEQGGAMKINYAVANADCFPAMIKHFSSSIDLSTNNVMKVRYKTSNVSGTVNLRVELADVNDYTTNGFPPDVIPLVADGNFHDFYFDFNNRWKCGYWPVSQSGGWWDVDPTQIKTMRIFVDYGFGHPAGNDSLWIDDISMQSTPPNPCVNITDPNVFDNFETERHVNYSTVEGWLVSMNNMYNTTDNSSYGIAKYVKDGSKPNAVLVGDFCNNLTLTTNNQLKLSVYNLEATPKTILISLQNFDGTNRREIGTATTSTTKTNQWEEVNFDFHTLTDSTAINSIVMILNPTVSVYDSIFIDNLRLQGFTNGINENQNVVSNVSVYPNPFVQNVAIEYSLKEQGQVKMNIVDVLGRTIEVIENKKQSIGKNIVNWQPKNLNQGIYYCLIEVNGKLVKTEKLVLAN